jgi:hypothetical protein
MRVGVCNTVCVRPRVCDTVCVCSVSLRLVLVHRVCEFALWFVCWTTQSLAKDTYMNGVCTVHLLGLPFALLCWRLVRQKKTIARHALGLTANVTNVYATRTVRSLGTRLFCPQKVCVTLTSPVLDSSCSSYT